MGRRRLNTREKLNRKLERLQKQIEEIRIKLTTPLLDDLPFAKKEEEN